jgi:hypothetical protein
MTMNGPDLKYTARERFWLLLVAALVATVANGAFLYGMLFRTDALADALSNPVAAPFIIEAFVMVGLLAYLFGKWGVSRLSWGWFVALSLLGGVAFAVPVAIVWGRPAR